MSYWSDAEKTAQLEFRVATPMLTNHQKKQLSLELEKLAHEKWAVNQSA
jgi:hypothetical protein